MTYFFEKLNEIDRPLAYLTKRKKEQIQINKNIDEMGNITKDTKKIQNIIWEFFKNLYSIKLENLN